jgi:eukaryotic-like serine/threonine-protein kinase
MIGERIGHLRVIASIGVGGMGAVWHAVDELLDRHVALKVIRPELMSRPGLAERFRSEAIVLARLQHPCIAALYGLEKRGDEFVMVMEYVDGQTLDVRLAQQTRLPWPEATRITRAVLDALDHAHESGVIHRDIKPSNVMITRAGRVKVMDFGIARLVGAERQTRTGAAVGTPSYMSPEQLLGHEVDGRADVYAVGTLLYELCTGHLPFEVEGDYLRMIAQLQEIPGAPSSLVADLPSGLDRIVARALQKEPDDRFSTSGDFRDALEELEREHGVWRPYGTPAAGSTPVQNGPRGGTPAAGVPAVDAQSAPNFLGNSAALLTPVDAVSKYTPVPFSIDPAPISNPASATPLDLVVPTGAAAASASVAPQPEKRLPFAQPNDVAPERPVVAAVSDAKRDIAADVPEPATRRGFPRALVAMLGIAAVAAAGVVLTRNVTERENQAAASATADSIAASPAAPVIPSPPVPPPAVITADTVDSTAMLALAKKATADSLRAVRKARADSVRASRDSLASVFDLSTPGGTAPAARTGSTPSVPVGPPTSEDAAKDAARKAASQCVALLNNRETGRSNDVFGGRKGTVMGIIRDAGLDATGPLRVTTEVDSDRATARFDALLNFQNSSGVTRSSNANMRAVVERKGTEWQLKRCLIDNDGGARF